MAVTHLTDVFESVKRLVITQYAEFGDDGIPTTKLMKLLKSVVNSLQTAEDSIFRFSSALDIDTATGSWLDLIGTWLATPRKAGESDSSYRKRLLIVAKTDSAGTPDNVIDNCSDLSGDPAPQYLDEVDCVFFVYNPNGRQLYRSQVQSLAPAGVLGLPGAGIKMVDSDELLALTDAEDGVQKLILMAALDEDISTEANAILTEDGGIEIDTEEGEAILTEG